MIDVFDEFGNYKDSNWRWTGVGEMLRARHNDIQKFNNTIGFVDWNPYITKLIAKLLIDTTPKELPYVEIPNLLNLNDKEGDIEFFVNFTKTFEKFNYDYLFHLIAQRDNALSRPRHYELRDLFEAVENKSVIPPELLLLQNQLYVLSGRTRLICAFALKSNIWVKVIAGQEIESILSTTT